MYHIGREYNASEHPFGLVLGQTSKYVKAVINHAHVRVCRSQGKRSGSYLTAHIMLTKTSQQHSDSGLGTRHGATSSPVVTVGMWCRLRLFFVAYTHFVPSSLRSLQSKLARTVAQILRPNVSSWCPIEPPLSAGSALQLPDGSYRGPGVTRFKIH